MINILKKRIKILKTILVCDGAFRKSYILDELFFLEKLLLEPEQIKCKNCKSKIDINAYNTCDFMSDDDYCSKFEPK